LDFIIHERGIEVGQKSISVIDKIEEPTNKKELQSLISKINFIRTFISNLSERIQPFTPLLKLKADQKFIWGEEQQKTLDDVKQYLKSPLVLMPPQDKKSFKLYLLANERAIRSALVQEFEGKERVIYFLSRKLLDAETRYSAVERLCLCLYFSCTKLRPYLLIAEYVVVCKDDVVKYMLSLPILKGRTGKWILALLEFDLTYRSAKAIKGQVMADLVTQHFGPEVAIVQLFPWTMFIDKSSCGVGAGIGSVLISPQGTNYEFSIPIEKTSTNNQAEYQTMLKGIKLLREVNAKVVEIFGDSQLVINQLVGEYEFKDDILRTYHEECLHLLREFKIVKIEHITKCHNSEANRLAQGASGYRPILTMELPTEDWRKDIMDYLKNLSKKVDKQLRYRAITYVLLEDELYYRTIDGVLLKFLGEEEVKTLMGEIHEGVCGAHQ
jgi:ribonuclease HI